MKYLRGYLVAAIVALFTLALLKFAEGHTVLVDMIWPYITRTYQTFMAGWSSGVSFCIWQVLAIFLVLLTLAGLVLTVLLKGSPIRLIGWVCAAASLVFFLHMGVYGLNANAGSIADDIHLTQTEYALTELEAAAAYFRDQANKYAAQVRRDGNGDPQYDSFEALAENAANGYEVLVYERSCSVFAGSMKPVKKLGWADMYTSMGITGFTFGITGEAAVNPQIPVVSLPFTMCHEMAHRMSIVTERDANFSAFLACSANEDPQFLYSAYFMAYRYCHNSLYQVGANAAVNRVDHGESELLSRDMQAYDRFFQIYRDEKATQIADSTNDTVLKVSGDKSGIASYGEVTDLLVSWYIQEVVLPSQQQEEQTFDPYDPNQVDLTGLPNAS